MQHFFTKDMLKFKSFDKRYEDFKEVINRELERCPGIKIQQVDFVSAAFQ